MTDPFQALLRAGNQAINNFPVTSRYYTVGTATMQKVDGTSIKYLRRRFIQPAASFELIQVYVTKEGDRLDNIAAAFIGDPEQFWQLADANNSPAPETLTQQPGTSLRITQPAGIRTY
ncbi:MAG: hypothetical protein JWR05_177 [Mucilaginibacter sp.]|nr:hypothetical protein [Mucilaginibacter sp.]